MAALHGPFDLLLPRAGGNDEPVVIAIASRLHQYRSFNYADATGVAGGKVSLQDPFAGADTGVDHGAEAGEQFRLAEDERAQFAPVDFAAGIGNARAELGNDGVVGFRAFGHHLVADLVGLDEEAAEIPQRASDEALSAGEAAGESYAEHRVTKKGDRPLCPRAGVIEKWSCGEEMALGQCDRVRHQHGDGERADASRNRRVGGGSPRDVDGMKVAHQRPALTVEFRFLADANSLVPVRDAGGADVDDGWAERDKFTGEKRRLAHGGDQDV